MATYIQSTLTAAVTGRDEEFNRWYDETHMPEILQIPGFVAGQRFALASPAAEGQPRYLAVYEIETDDLAATLGALTAAGPSLTLSDAIDQAATVIGIYEPIGKRRASNEDAAVSKGEA